MRGNHASNSTELHRQQSELMQHCEILILNYSACWIILRLSRLSVSADFFIGFKVKCIIWLVKNRVEPQFVPHNMVIHVCTGRTVVNDDTPW